MVDVLLRPGADETIVDTFGETAADVVAVQVEEGDRLADDVERARRLLANAPADRAWRLPGAVPCLPGQSTAEAGDRQRACRHGKENSQRCQAAET